MKNIKTKWSNKSTKYRFGWLLCGITSIALGLFVFLHQTNPVVADYAPDEFVTTWKTDNPGESNDNQITIPTFIGGNNNYNVAWEEVGNLSNNGTAGPFTSSATITFPSTGIYEIKITGSFPSIFFNGGGDRQKILTVEQWGTNPWSSMSFRGAGNLQILADDAPDLGNVTTLSQAFQDAISLNQSLNHWDVSSVASMQFMFYNATSFNQPLNNWDVSNVTSMVSMFDGATSFNQPLDNWDVSSVADMETMFARATSFNQPLNDWDTGNVTNMRYMFDQASGFNQELHNWDTGAVVNMYGLFGGATSFNQSLAEWDIGNVENMGFMLNTGAISTINYDSTLVGWASQSLQHGVTLGSTAQYCNAAEERQHIIDTFGWTINDGGMCVAIPTVVTGDSVDTNYDWVGVAIEILSDGGGQITDHGVEYGETTDYGLQVSYGLGGVGVVDVDIYNLECETTYHYRAYATNSAGTAYGEDKTFMTGACPILPEPFDVSLSGEIVGDRPIEMGEDASYRLRIANHGEGVFTGAQVIVNIPEEASYTGDASVNRAGYSVSCSDMGSTSSMSSVTGTDPGLWVGYTGNTLMCELQIDDGDPVLSNEDIFIDISLTAAQDFIDESTVLHALIMGDEYEADYSAVNAILGASPADPIYSYPLNNITGTIYESSGSSEDPDAFITTWKTDNPGESNDNQITIPTYADYIFNYNVYWEEVGNPSNNGTAGPFTGNATITFPSTGIYKISVTGDFPHIAFSGGGDKEKILTVEQWGSNQWSSMRQAFYGATNLQIVATDAPDLSNVTEMDLMFTEATAFNSNINHWDVSNVTSIGGIFEGATSFNQPLDNWDVSSVNNMNIVFQGATSFNQPLDNWDVSNVTSMLSMFYNATSFNQSLNSWATDSLIQVEAMFQGATSFNQPLSSWDVSNVTEMNTAFAGATSFNQSLNSWDVSNVTDMSGMFVGATSFNQPLSNWDVSSVTNMTGMFAGASAFDQTLATWDVANVQGMPLMFLQSPMLLAGMSLQPSGLSTENYDATLIAWSALTLQDSVVFDAGTSTYCDAASQRQSMIDTFNWTINDSGEASDCGDTVEDPDAFITTWKTNNPGESNDNQITIPTHPDEVYNYTVEWEEVGNSSNNGTAGPFTGDATITFPSVGTYEIQITGDFPRIFTTLGGDREKIITVEQWGANQWSSMASAFFGASNLQVPATDAPDLSNVTDMNSMFAGATAFNSNINHWDTSNVQWMINTFERAEAFNQPLDNWDTSSVTNMREMFSHATSFNQPIGSWDITSVNDIYLMFWHASSFNQPLDTWDVSGLTDIGSVFLDATSFNQPLNNWDVSGITGMASTFSGATSFNQPLDNWDVSNVVFMNSMFSWASSFNQPLNSWDVSSAVNMNNMFAAAESFNQPLNSWDVRNVQEMGAMFANTISFNQPLDNWDVSGVTSMYQMFSISAFDQSLASWDVSNVEDMFMMFGNLDAVIEEYMEGIPYEDWPQQYQDLYGLPASGLSTENYDATLTAWSQLTLQDDVAFDAGTSTYCDAASQRQSIIDTFGWTINDSGENCDDEEEPTDPETPGGSTPPTRPTTPPSTVTPDEPPVVPGEGEQPGVVEERTPEDDDEAAVVRDEDGLESEPGGGSTTPRRPGGEAVQGRENFVARTLDGVASFFGVSPIAVAQAFPWLLIILLLLLALVTAIKVIQQLFVIAKTRKLVARQALLNHEKKSLISLATHYLRTPLTILSSGIEMLPAESTARQTISKATAGLKTTIDELIGQIETNKNLVNLAEPSKPLHRRTSLLQPAIFVPTLLTLGLVLGANILIAVATAFDPGWQHVGIQILGVLIVGGLFYIAYDHHRQKKTLQAYEQQLLKHEEGLDVARNQFVKGMADTLVPAVVAVDTAVPAGLPEDTTKFLKEGLRQLEHTVGDFILIGQLEKQVLQQRATSVAVRDTVSRAQQQLEQSDAQLSVNVPADTMVHQPQFLLHKVFGSLIDNAVAHNKPNTPAEVTSKQGKAITAIEVTDYGEGIPEDKLSLLFKPLSRVQTAEDFTHQGIGLSLYVSRLIMHYLGGDISAASKVGKGTTMQVKVPNQMEV